MAGGQYGGVGADFVLYPLIYTWLKFAFPQNVEGCQRGEKEAPTDH